MLAGPESFFNSGKAILPWHDEPDSPEAKHEQTSTTHLEKLYPEKSPHELLPIDWQHGPRKAGISIYVVSPTSTAGKILQHCKELVGLTGFCAASEVYGDMW